MPVDHRSEFLTWDDIEAGSVELKNGTNPKRTYQISVMMRGPWNRKSSGSSVQFEGEVIAFSIPDKLLNPSGNEKRTITRDDVVVGGDGKRFDVLSSELSVNGSHWYVATCAER